ncbi:NYN domain-containing protein [Arhodomonas sp. SL1]|uniref:NYN domain-containing protein n=1 Tax=Arhodomonas sp. SL1 TaxID=3425691 RepID=UPI003F885D48
MKRLWLIDASYIHAVNLQLFGPNQRVDYLRLRGLIESRFGPLWRGYYLNGIQNETHEARDRFHGWLQSAAPVGPNLIVRLYGLKSERVRNAYCQDCGGKVDVTCPRGGDAHTLVNQRQMGVDVGLATLALVHKERYDTLVLSSGDGDLIDAVEHLSESGKGIELAVFSAGVSAELQARSDQVLWLDEHMDELTG